MKERDELKIDKKSYNNKCVFNLSLQLSALSF
jgi:hypothetical protein